MSFQHILAARQHLRSLGVTHLAGGGGMFDSGGWLSNMFSNPAKGMTVQNGFNANQPGITTTNFQPMTDQSAWDYKNSQAGLNDEFSDMRATAGSQVDSARNIGQQAANVSNLAQGPNGLAGVLTQQQGLAGQLQNEAAGRGPNPAQQQYQQNVNNAISQNSGMIASTKGVNPALAARMAAQGAASTEQGAAANEATLQAQQQLAAQQQLGTQQQAEAGTVLGQGQLYNTAGGMYGQQVGAQGAAANTMANAGQLAGTMGSLANNMYGTNVAGLGNQNNAINTASLGQQGINAGVASGNQKYTEGTQAGFINAVGGAIGLGGSSGGGGGGGAGMLASLFANGGEVGDQSQGILAKILAGTDQSGPFKPVQFGSQNGQTVPNQDTPNAPSSGGGAPLIDAAPYSGGAMGGSYLTSPNTLGMLAPQPAAPAYNGPMAPPAYANGGSVDAKAVSLAQCLMNGGGSVPGKANVPGNSLKNDVIPAALSPGEIVLPRSVTQSGDAPEKAAQFVANLKEKAHPEHKAKGGIVGHSLVADNHDHFVIQHGDGQQFKVAKNGLTAKMTAHIAKLPQVKHDADGTSVEDLDSESSYDPNGSSDPHYGATGSDDPTQTAIPSSGFGDGAAAPAGIPPGTPPPAPEAVPGEGNSFGVMPSDANSSPSGGGAAQPATASGSGVPDFNGQYLSDMTKSMGAQKAANNAKAEAEGLVADANKENANNLVGQQVAANDAFQTKHAELDARNDQLTQDVANTKIDPNHLWSSASSGSKLAMLAGILVSGFGANAGQGNMAMNVINKAIDHDIDAQKTNLNTKQNLLHYNLQRGRDLTAAQSETRLNLLATFKGQVARAAASQGSAIAHANAQGLNAQIDAQMAGIKHQVAQQHAMLGMMGGQGAAPGADPNDIDPQRLRASLLLGQQGYPNGIPKEQAAQAMKEYGLFKRQQDVSGTLAQQFAIMEHNHGIGIGNGPMASEAKKAYDAASNIVGTTVDHELAGRVTDVTLNALKESNMPRWGDSPETLAVKRNAVLDAIKAANSKDANGYGTLRTYGFLNSNNPIVAPSASIVKQTRNR